MLKLVRSIPVLQIYPGDLARNGYLLKTCRRLARVLVIVVSIFVDKMSRFSTNSTPVKRIVQLTGIIYEWT